MSGFVAVAAILAAGPLATGTFTHVATTAA